jgi:hypothetical protein
VAELPALEDTLVEIQAALIGVSRGGPVDEGGGSPAPSRRA